MFIIQSLENILANEQVQNKYLGLRQACETALEEIRNELKHNRPDQSNVVAAQPSSIINAEKYYAPFELACECAISQVMIIALDTMQKLISYGHLNGTSPDPLNPKRRLIDRLVETVCRCYTGPYMIVDVQLHIIKTLVAVITSQHLGPHGSVLIYKTLSTITKENEDLANQAARASLHQMLDTIFNRMKEAIQEESLQSPSATFNCSSPVLHTDAYLVFNNMCQSANEISDFHDKLLVHQLLSCVLQEFDPVLVEIPDFLTVIRRYLCVALVRDASSPLTDVSKSSLDLFLVLFKSFRTQLKPQCMVFLDEILSNILDNPHSTLDHKQIAFDALTKICCHCQNMIDLFVNYDCDISAVDIFQQMVQVLSKTAHQGAPKLRIKAITCLVSITQSMSEWRESNADRVETATGEEQQFEPIHQQKVLWRKGIKKFNEKHGQGLEFLHQRKLLGESASQIAEYLISERRLNKKQVGDYLGDENNHQVRYHYVRLMDFCRMDLISALRHFLQNFHLPTESQQITRLLEEFASRYSECNKSALAGEKAINSLVQFIVFVHGMTHDPKINEKITEQGFVDLNHQDQYARDFTEKYLRKIYREVINNEIRIEPTAQQLMESVSHVRANFTRSVHHEPVQTMFKVVYNALLQAFSTGLQEHDDLQVWWRSLNGISHAFHIACTFRIPPDAFIEILTAFASHKQLEDDMENADKIFTTLTRAVQMNANYLGNCWLHVFKCISRLARTQLSEIIGHDVDLIFDSFISLTDVDGDAVVESVRALCRVSIQELTQHAGEFSFHTILDIFQSNEKCIVAQWPRIKQILNDFFNQVLANDESVLAINVLRQLVLNVLDKESTNYQQDLMQIFENIMTSSKSVTIRQKVVEFTIQIVDRRFDKIGSGWDCIHKVFRLAVNDTDKDIAHFSRENIERIIAKYRPVAIYTNAISIFH